MLSSLFRIVKCVFLLFAWVIILGCVMTKNR